MFGLRGCENIERRREAAAVGESFFTSSPRVGVPGRTHVTDFSGLGRSDPE